MAKRRKLSEEETEAALGRIVHVEELLTLPEAEKLRRLDDEMGKVFKKKMSMDEKVKLFEETLANFRQVQEKIAKMGGVSMVREEDEQQNVTELIRTMVEEALDEREKKRKKKDGSMDEESSIEDSSMETVGDSTIPDNLMVSATSEFSMATPKKDGTFATSTPKNKKADISSSKEQGAVKSEIFKLLTEKGVVVKNQNLYFKTGSKKPMSYKKSFFDRVLNHLTLKDVADPPHNSHRLIELINNVLKEAEPRRYAAMLSSYPNMKKDTPTVFKKWESVK